MKYQLLLLEDLMNHGKKGDLVQVAPGFARNFLLPQGKAILASSSTLKMRERLKQERAEQAAKDKVLSEELSGKLSGQLFSVVVKVDPEGHMYGSVTVAEIADLLEKAGFVVNKKCIALLHPIRTIGAHQILLKLPEGVEATFGLEVKPDREIIKKVEPKVEAALPEVAPEEASTEESVEKKSKKTKKD